MSFDWIKYLDLAQHLVKNVKDFPDDEACFRTSVSRAYYSAFCTVRSYIRETDGDEYKGGDAHYRVREHLKDSGNKLKRKIANQLEMIHFNRVKADYHDSLREQPRNMAFKTITKAKDIVCEVEELRTRNSNKEID
ncbi:HEPN domain-containing protein [Desulfobacterales bacterium HSG2]|nr:HEPN domain-containing protein [Desulfobacterales bacterium HSG2]